MTNSPLIKVTPKARASFATVFTPKSFRQKDGSMSKEKYSLTLLFPKGTDLGPLREAAKLAAEKKWGAKIPKKLAKPIQDGDALDSDGDKIFPYDGYENMWVVKCSTEFKPKVKARDGLTDLSEEDFYSGCWCRAGVQAYAWDYEGMKKGVSFALIHVQKLGDDEPFSGRQKAEDMFDDDVSEKDEASQLFDDDTGF
jgi:hypothetical protein